MAKIFELREDSAKEVQEFIGLLNEASTVELTDMNSNFMGKINFHYVCAKKSVIVFVSDTSYNGETIEEEIFAMPISKIIDLNKEDDNYSVRLDY